MHIPVVPLVTTHQNSRQSVPVLHIFPLGQAVVLELQLGPPQSTSVSCSFCTVSAQVGAEQVLLEPQTPFRQSVGTVQPRPVPQRAQLEVPPQSVPLSP